MCVKQACVICKHHNLWDTSTEGLLSFKQMVQHIRYTYNVPSGLAMIESVKVSNTHTHSLTSLVSLNESITLKHFLLWCRQEICSCIAGLWHQLKQMTRSLCESFKCEILHFNGYIHSQGLGFTTVFNNRCESHTIAYGRSSNKICMNE